MPLKLHGWFRFPTLLKRIHGCLETDIMGISVQRGSITFNPVARARCYDTIKCAKRR